MRNLIGILSIAIMSQACQGGSTAPVSTTEAISPAAPVSQPVPSVEPASPPTSTPTPAPSATPSPTPTLVMFNDGETINTAFDICTAFESFNNETTTIRLNEDGYFYTFSSTGVTVTYSAGPDNGQTMAVLDPTDLTFGPGPDYECSLSIDNGILLSVTHNND